MANRANNATVKPRAAPRSPVIWWTAALGRPDQGKMPSIAAVPRGTTSCMLRLRTDPNSRP